jgi:hypothetical protein
MSNQSDKQQKIRTVTGKSYPYEGDWHAYWDSLGNVTGNTFDERMLKWINNVLATSYSSLPQAQQAYAQSVGAINWDSIGTNLFSVLAILWSAEAMSWGGINFLMWGS